MKKIDERKPNKEPASVAERARAVGAAVK